MSMEARLWRRLPFELVDRVLSFLPVPDLCRYSVVCKRWDSLISSPAFGTLCLWNAARKGVGYIVGRVVEECMKSEPKFNGWSILDLEARRWYRIKHDHDQGEEDDSCSSGDSEESYISDSVYHGFVAADGGLVCECVSWDDCVKVNISNPLMRREIMSIVPDTPRSCWIDEANLGTLDLVVHNVDNSFKVFYINQGGQMERGPGDSEDPEEILRHTVMPIYESTTGKWRSSTNPSSLEVGHECGSSVMFQGLLHVWFYSADYIRFQSWNSAHYRLFSYNISEDVWEDTGVQIYSRVDDSPQLLVSDNRLFMLYWMDVTTLRVCEILLADIALPVVFEMTSSLVQLVFRLEGKDAYYSSWHPEIQAFGFDKSLILMSSESGIPISYNLVSRSWGRMPTNPMHPLPEDCKLWYGKTMNLRLPGRRGKKNCTCAACVNADQAVLS